MYSCECYDHQGLDGEVTQPVAQASYQDAAGSSLTKPPGNHSLRAFILRRLDTLLPLLFTSIQDKHVQTAWVLISEAACAGSNLEGSALANFDTIFQNASWNVRCLNELQPEDNCHVMNCLISSCAASLTALEAAMTSALTTEELLVRSADNLSDK